MPRNIFRGEFLLLSAEVCENPLRVGVSMIDHDLLTNKTTQEGTTALAIAQKRCILSSSCIDHSNKFNNATLFALVQPLSLVQESKASQNDNTGCVSEPLCIKVYCTDLFLRRYGFDIHDKVYLTVTHLFPLYKVVLEAKSDRAFGWVKEQSFSTSLLLSVIQESVLVRKGDPFIVPSSVLFNSDSYVHTEGPSSLTVLNTEPVSQGALTINTEVVIVHHNKESMETNASNSALGNGLAIVSSSDLQSATLKSEPAARPLKDQPWIINTGVSCTLPDCRHADDGLHQSNGIDIHNCLFVSRTFAMKAGLFHGSFVEVKMPDCDQCSRTKSSQIRCKLKAETGEKTVQSLIELNGVAVREQKQSSHVCAGSNSKKTKRLANTRLAWIHLIDSDKAEFTDECQVFVYPTLLLNLSKNTLGSILTQKTKLQVRKFEGPTSVDASSSWFADVPRAHEVHIAGVNSPDYSVGSSFNTALQQFFNTARYMNCSHFDGRRN